MVNQAGDVARILYKEITPGDLRKILAKSNDSQTGGGARDFRFGSYKKLLPIILQMFPRTAKLSRKRDNGVEEIDGFQGEFFWYDKNGEVKRKNSFFEPPTDARPAEGRIVRVPQYECFEVSRIPEGGINNRILLLLIQLYDGSVWPYYVEERTLSIPDNWHPQVAEELLNCLNANRAASRAVIGYQDFTNSQRYCNGK